MPIPDYQTLVLPLLRLTRDGAEHPFRDVVDALATDFQLSDEERSELLPSGTAHVFGSRVGWARSYLLTSLMVDHNVAVAKTGTYELKKIDTDYFEGE